MSRLARWRATGIFYGYRAAERLACALPEWAVPGVATATGTFAWAVLPSRRAVVGRHLARVAHPGRNPDQRAPAAEVRDAFRSYAQYWLDTFRLPVMDLDVLDRRAQVDGLEVVDEALAHGRGAIIALPHMGSWDQAGAWLAHRGYRITVVMERLQPRRLQDWFVAARERIGLYVVVRGEGVWEELEKALADGHLIGLVCDRDLSGRGVPVQFFGERTTLPAGPARLAVKAGAPLLPVGVYRGPGHRWSAVVRPPLEAESAESAESAGSPGSAESAGSAGSAGSPGSAGSAGQVEPAGSGEGGEQVAALSRRLAEQLEQLISRAPTQWHLMQPNWPSDHDSDSDSDSEA